MKFFLSFFTIFLFLLNPVNSEQKIVFVDMDKVISKSNSGSSIFKQLKSINNKNLTLLKKEEEKFKKNETKLISQKNIISEIDYKTKVVELRSEIDNYNQKRKKINFFQLKTLNPTGSQI